MNDQKVVDVIQPVERNKILEDITVSPLDLEAVQKTIDSIMEYMATDGLPFADGYKVLNQLQEYINAWQTNTNSLIVIMDRIGVPLINQEPIEEES